MRIAIFDKIVRHNIELFKKLILRQLEKNEKQARILKKAYVAYINRKTGEIRFADLEKAPLKDKEWKMIHFRMRLPEHPEDGLFEIVDGVNEDRIFEYADLGSIASHALAETVKTLNTLVSPSAKLKNVDLIFQELSELEIESSEEKREIKDLIHEAWHQVDRIQAEKLLMELPVGTYFFRKDEFAASLEAQLNAHNSHPIKCITLTYSEWDGKISEKTVVFKHGRWLLYNDDLELHGPTHPTIESLLEAMDDVLSKPLFHD